MVRRIGFGGGEKPNPRDAELRKKYHQVDGNHSGRAHRVTAQEPAQPRPESRGESTTEPQADPQPRPTEKTKQVTGWRFIRNVIIGFWALSFVMGSLGKVIDSLVTGRSMGGGNYIMLFISVIIIFKAFKFIQKYLSGLNNQSDE